MSGVTEPVEGSLEVAHGQGLLRIATLDWGGDGPLVLLHHANGFCAGVWNRVAQRLRDRFRVVAMDARGHGASERPAEEGSFDWWALADDLAEVTGQVLAQTGAERVALGLGHSFGGTVMLGALSRNPELFERVMVLDPVIIAKALRARMGRGGPSPMVTRARARRAVFDSREQALGGWREKPFFQSWAPGVLEDYGRYGLRDREDGRVELCCAPEVEATVFSTGGTIDLFEVERWPSIPVRFHWASGGNFSRATYEALAARMPDARVGTVETGHLVPMEDPELVVGLARALVDGDA